MNRCKSEKSTKISNLWSLLFQLPSSASWIFRYESWWFGFPFYTCVEVSSHGDSKGWITLCRPNDHPTSWTNIFSKKELLIFQLIIFCVCVCVFFGPKQKTLHLCPGWSPGYWVLKSDTSRIQWNRVPLIASKSSSWKPEMWMVLEFWSWNKNDSEYFHFHQFWAKRDLPV